MSYLNKDEVLIKRNEKGELLPVDVTLELLEDKSIVQLIPLTKGDIQELYSIESKTERFEIENRLISEHLVNPKLTIEEVKVMKPSIYGATLTALLSISLDMTQEELRKIADESVIENLEVKKKLN